MLIWCFAAGGLAPNSVVCLNAPAPGAPGAGFDTTVDTAAKLMWPQGLESERWNSLVAEQRQFREALEAYHPAEDCTGITLHIITTDDASDAAAASAAVTPRTASLREGEAWRNVCSGVAPSDVLLYACDGGREAAGVVQRILAAQSGGTTSFEGYQQVRLVIGGSGSIDDQPAFKCASGASAAELPAQQCADAFAQVVRGLCAPPSLLFMTSSGTAEEAHETLSLLRALAPAATIHAVSSLHGSLGQHGKAPFGLFGLTAGSTRAAVGVAAGASNPTTARAAARIAIRQALADAGAPNGVAPAVVFLSPTPGAEEAVLAGIADELGKDVPVIGGSAADQGTLDGSWWVAAAAPATPSTVIAGVAQH